MAFNDNFRATTNALLMPKVMDTVLKKSPLAMMLLANRKKWITGEKLKKGIIIETQANGGSFSGYDTLNTNASHTKVTLAFDPKETYLNVVFDSLERDVNATDKVKSVGLVEEKMEEAANGVLQLITTQWFGPGTGNGGKDFLGLGAIVDDGTTAATYGGLSRTTYTSLVANVQGAAAGLTSLTNLQAGETAARKGTDVVNLHITSDTHYNEYENLLTPTIRANYDANGTPMMTRFGLQTKSTNGLAGGYGFTSLVYKGAPVVADQQCPANRWFGLNMNYLHFYAIPTVDPNKKEIKVVFGKEIEGVGGANETPSGFLLRDVRPSENQNTEIGYVFIQGELASFNPRTHFRIDFNGT